MHVASLTNRLHGDRGAGGGDGGGVGGGGRGGAHRRWFAHAARRLRSGGRKSPPYRLLWLFLQPRRHCVDVPRKAGKHQAVWPILFSDF